MKIIVPFVAALVLIGCAHNQQETPGYGADMQTAGHPVGNDGLPSVEVIAFQQVDARLGYRDARIEHDADRCAVYQGTAPDGQVRREPLLDAAGKRICVRS